jgi:hypothetical protein
MFQSEEKEKPKKILIILSPSQKDLLKKIGFTYIEYVQQLTHAEIVFYSGKVLLALFQEEVTNMKYKSKFLQFKFWCTKQGGEPIQQQPYLKKISKENMSAIAADFGFELPDIATMQIELKRKAERVNELENVVGELTKKIKGFETMLANLAEKSDLKALLKKKEEPKGADDYEEDENFYSGDEKNEEKREVVSEGKVINFELLGQLLGGGSDSKKKNKK